MSFSQFKNTTKIAAAHTINISLTLFSEWLTRYLRSSHQFCTVRTQKYCITFNCKQMKRIALILFSFALITCVFAQELALNTKRTTPSFTPEKAVFAWTTKEFDFGKIKVGVPVTYEFSFTNTGDIPLVISTVQASCGCTVTSYSKDPIEPNTKGFVKATYNAAHVGQFTKTVTVNANTEESIVQLVIKGEVVQ